MRLEEDLAAVLRGGQKFRRAHSIDLCLDGPHADVIEPRMRWDISNLLARNVQLAVLKK